MRTVFRLDYEDWDGPYGKISEHKMISLDKGSNLSKIEVNIKGTNNISAGISLQDNNGSIIEINNGILLKQNHFETILSNVLLTSSKYLVVLDNVYPIHPVVFPWFFFNNNSIPYESPSPKVNSCVINLFPRNSGLTVNEENLFLKWSHSLFQNRRKTLLNGMEFDVAKEMIKSGIETLNSDIDVDALDDDVIDSFLKKDPEDRVVH